MQWRQVATAQADDVSGSYAATTSQDSLDPSVGIAALFGPFTNGLGQLFSGVSSVLPTELAGANKNDLLQTVTAQYTNVSPLDQLVYGIITRGGCRVTLQARSRGYLVVSTGQAIGVTPGNLTIASVIGCGADIGAGGVLAIGTAYCIIEERQNAASFPLAPEVCGWVRVQPGETFTGQVTVRFVSEFWENSQIDGGDLETESSYDAGATRLDLFAVPALD
jgi:hypothetical protein